MGSLSDYVEKKLLDHVLHTADWAQETNLYVGLSTADPLDDASGIAEPAHASYNRINHDSWDVAASRSTENSGTISFDEAEASWGTITHFFVCNHLDNDTWGTNVELIAHGLLSASKAIGIGDNASFQDGAITVSFNTGGISDYLSNESLDHIFKNTAYDTTTSLYVALTENDPTDDGSGENEPTIGVGAYARVNHTVWTAASGATAASENTGAITFPQASVGWGTVAYFMILDESSGGNMLVYGALDNSRNIGLNDTPSFASGALDITID
jgi:hypothetical protein